VSIRAGVPASEEQQVHAASFRIPELQSVLCGPALKFVIQSISHVCLDHVHVCYLGLPGILAEQSGLTNGLIEFGPPAAVAQEPIKRRLPLGAYRAVPAKV
jgi:hypothetical protein